MDRTKAAKNAKPTIKLGEVDFTPVYIAFLVVLISIGKVSIQIIARRHKKSSFEYLL